MYILESKDRNERVEAMEQRPEMTKTMVAPQKIEHGPWAWEVVCDAILVAHVGEIWDKPIGLQVGSTHILEVHGGVLT